MVGVRSIGECCCSNVLDTESLTGTIKSRAALGEIYLPVSDGVVEIFFRIMLNLYLVVLEMFFQPKNRAFNDFIIVIPLT